MENHYMVDIETSGTDFEKDDILELASIELEYKYPFWYPVKDFRGVREFHCVLHYPSYKPLNDFAKKTFPKLIEECNQAPESHNYDHLRYQFRKFLHEVKTPNPSVDYPGSFSMELPDNLRDIKPKLFMGLNASVFDMPFIIKKVILTPCYYEKVGDKEQLVGDIHYRNYEQMGAINYVCNMTGLGRRAIEEIALDLNPTKIDLPKGGLHRAHYDCYRQLVLMNGLIELGRRGWRV